MNFTQPSDFLYVTGANIDALHPYGDLNRIEIDNAIMPVRNTENKRNLRGIDIAFLMEAIEERRLAVSLDGKSNCFYRNPKAEQLIALRDNLDDIANAAGDYRYICDEIKEKDDIGEYTPGVEWKFITSRLNSGVKKFIPNHISIDAHEIIASDVSSLFGEVGKCCRLITKYCDVLATSGATPSYNISGEGYARTAVENSLRSDGGAVSTIGWSMRTASNNTSGVKFASGTMTATNGRTVNIRKTPSVFDGNVAAWGVFNYHHNVNVPGSSTSWDKYYLRKISNTANYSFDDFMSIINEIREKNQADIDSVYNEIAGYEEANGWTYVGCYYLFPEIIIRDRTRWSS